MDAVHVEKLTKKYGEKGVLKEVDLKIEEGEFYTLMGPNGSGKTTLASIMASVRSPTSGKIRIYARKPEKAREFIGYVPQEIFSSPILTGKENLMYFAGEKNEPFFIDAPPLFFGSRLSVCAGLF